jgi:succinyl-CoA synthetase beta subunit
MHDPSQDDPRESEAAKNDLSYVSLDGNIGCMVNGAGLAMGTMDTIKFYGGNPANFLDVGGTATQERVAKAFKLILEDPEVKVVLVNIFGGIVRCDLIAEGILAAIEEVGVEIPVVVRLEGNSADIGSKILSESGVKIESRNDLADAAKKAVELSR